MLLMQVHAPKHPLADDIDLQQVANDVPGLVGADLAFLLNEAALQAVHDGEQVVQQRHIQVLHCQCSLQGNCAQPVCQGQLVNPADI